MLSDAAVEAGEGMYSSEVRLNSNLCVKIDVHMRLSDEKLCEFRAECKEVLQLRGSEPEANTASDSQIPGVLWNHKVQRFVHKNSSLVPLLSHVNPIFALSFFSLNHMVRHPRCVFINCNWINQLSNTTIWWLDICCLLHRYQLHVSALMVIFRLIG